MANYNKNSVFSVSGAGVIPNTVDPLIFFEDIAEGQQYIWDEFETLMASGDYDAENNYITQYAEIHGYFGDLYNLMVSRIKAAQEVLINNRTRINNGTAPFQFFVKPEIFKYQTSPDGIVKDQVWIGGKDYFNEVTQKEGINKLQILNVTMHNNAFSVDSDGIITLNGVLPDMDQSVRIGRVADNVVSNAEIWSYWNYYISGRVDNYNGGHFLIKYTGNGQVSRSVRIDASRTANMHANLLDVARDCTVELWFYPRPGESYVDLKVAFMICKTKETTPNQKFEPYKG